MADLTQADIDAAVAKVTADFEKRIEAIDAKKNEAIDEAKKAKQALRAHQDIKPEDLTAAEERAEKAETALREAQNQVKSLTKERDTAVKSLEAEQGFTNKLLIQDGLKSALIASGVKDEDFLDSLTHKFSSGATIKSDGEARVAMLGDKALADAIKEWAGTDAGKKFVAAADNSGAGAPGGKGGSPGKSISEADFNAMSGKDRAAFMNSGGSIAAAA